MRAATRSAVVMPVEYRDCRRWKSYPQAELSTGRSYPQGGVIHRLDLSTGWTYPQAGLIHRREVGGCSPDFCRQSRNPAKSRRDSSTLPDSPAQDGTARAHGQTNPCWPKPAGWPMAKNQQWPNLAWLAICNLAAELQRRAELQLAIPILSTISNRSCNSKLEIFTTFGNARSFGNFPKSRGFLTRAVFLNEKLAGRENCQTT